ncbi:hypothetical protein AYR62_12345 [Secundilactobacillus paracollinoides]|uniref:DUF4430 domain-containing protein n=1 Tax=Secundilactobacillus paracollinoides TaxID=240427 RepID=UPI00081A3295|nr:DUF4430 domain-containing protein [Secundilactobacillus paracollinoides]ANZ64789.1 hypothetical protein AYR62_12345 [Secundilactobacillus paracollinoides]
MSKKKIFAIIASLVIIFGLGFAGYSAMHKSASNNSYTTQKQDKSKTSSSESSSSAPEKAEKAVSSSASSAATSSNGTTTTDASGKVSKLKDGNSTGTTGTNGSTGTTKSTTGSKKSGVKSVTASATTHKTTAHATTSHAATCSLIVRGPISSGNKVLLSASNIRIHSGDKVSTVLKRVTAEKHVALSYQGAGASIYIRGIKGLFEFDKGSGSGWLYSVNNKFPGYSAGKYKVKSGDKIQWLYTENLGKDRDAPQVTQN